MTIDDVCHIKTGKLDSNAEVIDGSYPFFTCAAHPTSIDHYAYDDDVILIAGNNAQGNFHVNRYKGRFNAYQRTYILSQKGNNNLDFTHYALKLLLRLLKERSQGSQTKFLTMAILKGLELPFHSSNDRIKIAHLLKTLDKKIELNNKINTELESMAKLIYDYWFVQFDFPITAEQAAAMGDLSLEGKPYKASGGPMTHNKTLKREIPEGWSVSTLTEQCQIFNGYAFKSEWYQPKGDQVIRTKDFSKGVVNPSKEIFLSKEKAQEFNKYRLQPYDTLMVMVGASLGKFAIAYSNAAGMLQNQNMWRFRSHKNTFHFNLALQDIIKTQLSVKGGSARSFFQKENFKKLPFICPDPSTASAFEDFAEPIVKQIDNSIQQNQQLTELRDWLLPMLMNGQVTVIS